MTSNPELLRQINDAIERRDWEALSQRMHREVVWRHNIGIGTPEEGEYEGRESVLALFERIAEPWEYVRPAPSEVRDLGDGVLAISGDLHAKHKASAAEIVTPYQQRLEFQGGVVVRGGMVQGAGASLGAQSS